MPVISVAAVIDTANPSAWIIHLVKRLQQRDCVKLMLVELVDASDAPDTIKPDSVTHRTVQWLLGKMDRPLFEQNPCLLYTSPSPRDRQKPRMPSSA